VCWLRYCGNAGFGELKIVTNVVVVNGKSKQKKNKSLFYIKKEGAALVAGFHTAPRHEYGDPIEFCDCWLREWRKTVKYERKRPQQGNYERNPLVTPNLKF